MGRSHQNDILNLFLKFDPPNSSNQILSQPQYKQEKKRSGSAVVEEPENPPSRGMHTPIKWLTWGTSVESLNSMKHGWKASAITHTDILGVTLAVWRRTCKYLHDCSPPASSVHGILQARILKWLAIPFSRGSSWPRDWTQVSSIAGRFCTSWATREAL